MAGGFNIANLFRPTQQVTLPQPSTAPQPTGQPGSTLNPAPAGGAGGDPNAAGGAGAGGANANNSPLDKFKDMWKTPENGAGTSTDPFASPLFQMDPAKLREAAGQMDFLSSVPQELMQKVMAGNDPQSLMQLIQHVGQQSLATALQLSTATTEQAGQRIGQRFKTALPESVRSLQIDQQQPTNPVLNHPAAQQMLKMTRQQIKMANPDFTPQQVQEHAEQYLTTFASALQGGDPTTKPAGGASEQQDWLAWAEGGQHDTGGNSGFRF